MDTKNYLITINGSNDGLYALLDENYVIDFTQSATHLMNLRTGVINRISAVPSNKIWPVEVGIGVVDSIFFIRDSAALIKPTLLDYNGLLMAVSVSTSDGVEKELCPGVRSKILYIKERNDTEILILSYNQNTRILDVYITGDETSCRKINSVAVINSTTNALFDVSIAPDNLKILVRLGTLTEGISWSGNGNTQESWINNESNSSLLYIPLDGKPGISINTPIFEAAQISHARFLGDSKTVLFRGNQIRPNENNVFLWKAP